MTLIQIDFAFLIHTYHNVVDLTYSQGHVKVIFNYTLFQMK